jgi:hypothetical protein
MAQLLPSGDPLALVDPWPCEVPLTGFSRALEISVFRSGLSRADWLKRLAADLHKPQLLPLLWLLPRGWKLAPAQLPARLQALGSVLERGLLTPALLAALADDLPHLLPSPPQGRPNALDLWLSRNQPPLPRQLNALLALPAETEAEPAAPHPSELSGGLLWQNTGLAFAQSAPERQRNSLVARVLNRLGANRLGGEPWSIEGSSSSRALLRQLEQRGWQGRARWRSSIASFGLGASLPDSGGGWNQVPIGLPIRSGLLNAKGEEIQALLPHSCLELELSSGDQTILLQFYQGTEGLCGWEGLNDLHRPWQNDRQNATVRYLGEPLTDERLAEVFELCELVALIHNLEASERQLCHGGYGSLGFCIDSSALLQQAMEGRCQLFPVLIGGIWRERLLQRAGQLTPADGANLERYRLALEQLPHDASLHGEGAEAARQRLIACQPLNSPFALVQQLREHPTQR